MANCYASKKDRETEEFPLNPAIIAKYQAHDGSCKKYSTDKQFRNRTVEGEKILSTEAGQLVVPRKLQERVLAWYHHYLGHPGATRMLKTMEATVWWKTIRQDVEHTVRKCRVCQKNKKVRKKYGKLPPKDVEQECHPWDRVNIDLIGPLSVKTPSGTHSFDALTMIDPATGWFEVKEIKTRSAEAVSAAFDDCWLTRYPRPHYLGFDNGSENKGVFKQVMDNYMA